MKELFIKFIKTLFFNVIGCFILCKSYMYTQTHDDISFLIDAALFILFCIGFYFIRVDFFKHTDKETAEVGISLFIYALKRLEGKIEENEHAENLLKDSPFGEAVKEFIDNIIELNEIKEKEEKG